MRINITLENGNRFSADLPELVARECFGEFVNKLSGIVRSKAVSERMEVAKGKSLDLSKMEQGILIKELCQRKGISSYIGKTGEDYEVSILKDNGEVVEFIGEKDIGPVNIIVVTNNI